MARKSRPRQKTTDVAIPGLGQFFRTEHWVRGDLNSRHVIWKRKKDACSPPPLPEVLEAAESIAGWSLAAVRAAVILVSRCVGRWMSDVFHGRAFGNS